MKTKVDISDQVGVIFRYEMVKSQRIARCVFAERRELVYELFAEVIRRLLEA
jgi:hypothetical protein